MTIGRMCNPQSFCKEAHKLNIRYQFLMEAREVLKLWVPLGTNMKSKKDDVYFLDIIFFSNK